MIYSKENRILFSSSRIQTMLQTHSETTFSAEAEQSTVLLDGIGKIPFVVLMLSTSNKNSYHQTKRH